MHIAKALQPICFVLKFNGQFNGLTVVLLKSSKQATELSMLHVMNLRLFEDIDTDLVSGHVRSKGKLYPDGFPLMYLKQHITKTHLYKYIEIFTS